MHYAMRTTTAFLGLLIITATASVQAQVRLFQDPPAPSGVSVASVPASITPVESVTAHIAPQTQRMLETATTGTTLILDMLPGHTFNVELTDYVRNEIEAGAYTWSGRLADNTSSTFMMATYNNVTVGTLELPDGDVYTISYNGDGTHQVTKSHPVENHYCGVDDHVHVAPPAPTFPGRTAPDGEVSDMQPRSNEPIEFDVLFGYYKRITELNGGEDAVQAMINMGVAYLNQAIENSDFPAEYEPHIVKVGTIELDAIPVIPEVPGGGELMINGTRAAEVELQRLMSPSDGHIDIMHDIKNAIGADFVHLLAPVYGPGVVGYAHIGLRPEHVYGWSSGARGNLQVARIIAHELGHNLGANHDYDTDNLMRYLTDNRPYFSHRPKMDIVFRLMSMGSYPPFPDRPPTPRAVTHLENDSAVITVQQGAYGSLDHAIYNVGNAPLNFSAGPNVIPPVGQVGLTGTRSTTVTLLFDARTLEPGAYDRTVSITGGFNGTVELPVTLHCVGGAPAHDLREDAELIAAPNGTLYSTNVNATSELGLALNSVWYKWMAEADGPISFDTEGSEFDTMLLAVTDDGTGPVVVAQNDDIEAPGNTRSRITIEQVAGEIYYIAVAGSGAADFGAVQLNWGDNRPANDHFADAIRISDIEGSVAGDNTYATLEPGESPVAADAELSGSIWYKWTPPSNRWVIFTTEHSEIDTVLAAYEGTSHDTLTTVAENNDYTSPLSRIQFEAVSGTTYYIMVAGIAEERGRVILNWNSDPSADVMLSLNTLEMNLQTQVGQDASPTRITVINDGHSDRHYSITWDASWLYVFNSEQRRAWRGTRMEHGVFFNTSKLSPGTYTDEILISSPNPREPDHIIPVTLTITDTSVPVPHSKAGNAVQLEGMYGIAYGSGINAGTDIVSASAVGEIPLDNSVWFTWQTDEIHPPFTQMTVDITGQDPEPQVGLFRSPSEFYLSTGPPEEPEPSLLFDLHAHFPYYIGVYGADSPVQVRWGTNLPENDNFSTTMESIDSDSGTVTGNNTQATRQSGEPSKMAGQEVSHSIWYRFHSTRQSHVWFSTLGSEIDTLLGVYTGSAVNDLTSIRERDDDASSPPGISRLEFEAFPGVDYFIRVDGKNFATGNIVLNWGQSSSVGGWELY